MQSHRSTCLVLLAEKDSIVALEMTDELTEAGYEVAGAFSTSAAALTWLETNSPDVAVLDIVLKDGPCTKLAAELNRRDVPLVVFSVRYQSRNTMPEFMNATWVEKPASGKAVLVALTNLRREHV